MGRETRILSVDGGGIRGIIPALVLSHVEEQAGKPIAELFDVIAGTSTGGIIALALTCPGAGGRPKFTAAEVVSLYERDGPRIFPHELFGKLRQLVEEKYPSRGLDEVMAEHFGEARLKDALTGVLVTAYDLERRKPLFFRSERAKETPAEHDFPMGDIARATSAAPTYFEPVRLPAPAPGPDYACVDGGVFAVNPGMCAYVDAWVGRARAEETLMVSLGTGAVTRPIHYEDARHWGLVGWGRRILDVVFDGVSDTVDFQLEQVLGTRDHRFQTRLETAKDELDDASAANIANLEIEGERLIETRRSELDQLARELAA